MSRAARLQVQEKKFQMKTTIAITVIFVCLVTVLRAADAPVSWLPGETAQGPLQAQTLLDRFSWSPEYSREKLHQVHDAILALKIDDADFFGVFENGRWVKPPMLDYAYENPALRDVEAAAKSGDYEKAAAALLVYYQARPARPGKKPTQKLPADFASADCFYAARTLQQIVDAGGPGLFKREGCTPRECVELQKTVVRLGMQVCSGYAPNANINSLGGNWITWALNALINAAPVWPELVDSKRWIEKAHRYIMANLKYVIWDDGSYVEHTFGYARWCCRGSLTIRSPSKVTIWPFRTGTGNRFSVLHDTSCSARNRTVKVLNGAKAIWGIPDHNWHLPHDILMIPS